MRMYNAAIASSFEFLKIDISVSRLKKQNCKYEYENFSYLEKKKI